MVLVLISPYVLPAVAHPCLCPLGLQYDPALEEVDDPGPSLLGQKRQLQEVRRSWCLLYGTEVFCAQNGPISVSTKEARLSRSFP